MGERVATWQRVSSDGQETANQTATLERHCDSNGYEVARRFILPDTSAFKGKHQDALDGILADVAAGAYTRVVAVTSSRFERRGVAIGLRFILDLAALGGRLETADNPLFGDTSNLAGWIVSVASGDADNTYSQKISDNVNRAFRLMDDNGSFRGCPPIGYMVVGEKRSKRLVPDPQRADDVRTAFTDATTGTGTTELAQRLGLKTADAAAKMLRNATYSSGRYMVHRSDGVVVSHRCEALINPDVQRAAIAALESRRTGDNVSSRAIAKHDLSGAVYCVCDADLGMHRYFGGGKVRLDGTKGDRTRRYRCRACGKSVNADHADAAVDALMLSRSVAWLDRWLIPGDDHAAELDRVRLEYRELSARGLDFDAEDQERDRLRGEIKRLESLPSNPARTETGFVRDAQRNALSEGDRWRSLDNAARRAWLTSGEFRVSVSAAGDRSGRVTVELIYEPDDADE